MSCGIFICGAMRRKRRGARPRSSVDPRHARSSVRVFRVIVWIIDK